MPLHKIFPGSKIARDDVQSHCSDRTSSNAFAIHERKIRLVNGPFDGLEVEDDSKSEILWVYQKKCGEVVAVRAHGVPRTLAMAAYVVMPGRTEAMHGMT